MAGRGRPGVVPQTVKREQYAALMARGVSSSEACRIVGINRRTGNVGDTGGQSPACIPLPRPAHHPPRRATSPPRQRPRPHRHDPRRVQRHRHASGRACWQRHPLTATVPTHQGRRVATIAGIRPQHAAQQPAAARAAWTRALQVLIELDHPKATVVRAQLAALDRLSEGEDLSS
jgi:hypothetical protein